MALLIGLVGVAVLAPAPNPAHAAMGPGSFTRFSHPGVGNSGPRDYLVYEPATTAGGARPLVVMLHGCNQDATDVAIGTRWTELAERRNFVVVFPEQSRASNGLGCWNWFDSNHQARGAGEPAVIAGITARVVEATSADRDRVYVMGLSAGADMAMILAATYPDVYAAVGGFAGCAYATCTDVTGAMAHRSMGPRAQVVAAFLVQGTADPLNNFALGATMARQWVGTNDLADDGAANGSVAPTPTRVDHVGFDPSTLAQPGTVGDTCVRARQFPCAGALVGAKSYPYSIEHHGNAGGCDVVDFWIVHGLSHNYPGGDPAGTFTDSIGPDITTGAYDFFTRHSLGSPCGAVRPASAPAAVPVTLPVTGASEAEAWWTAAAMLSAAVGARGLAARARPLHCEAPRRRRPHRGSVTGG